MTTTDTVATATTTAIAATDLVREVIDRGASWALLRRAARMRGVDIDEILSILADVAEDDYGIDEALALLADAVDDIGVGAVAAATGLPVDAGGALVVIGSMVDDDGDSCPASDRAIEAIMRRDVAALDVALCDKLGWLDDLAAERGEVVRGEVSIQWWRITAGEVVRRRRVASDVAAPPPPECVVVGDPDDDDRRNVDVVEIDDAGHEWTQHIDWVGGCDTNPGEMAHGGTVYSSEYVCRRCGMQRTDTRDGDLVERQYDPSSLAWYEIYSDADSGDD